MRFTYRDNGILRRGVPFGVILERSEGSRKGHLSLRMTVEGCRLCLKYTYRDNGILRRGVPFGVILERSEGSRRGHLDLRMTVLICWRCLFFTYRSDVFACRKSGCYPPPPVSNGMHKHHRPKKHGEKSRKWVDKTVAMG